MRHASITTSAISRAAGTVEGLVTRFPTWMWRNREVVELVIGYAPERRGARRPSAAWASMGSIYTVSSRRSLPLSAIWMRSIQRCAPVARVGTAR